MDFENIHFMWKDEGSNVGNCPALSRVEGGYLVTGKKVTRRTRRRVARISGVGANEVVSFVPDNVLDRLRGDT